MKGKILAGMAVIAVIAFIMGAAAGTVATRAQSSSTTATASTTMPMQQNVAQNTTGKISTIAFHDAMRKLWEDHITWTRLAIVSFAGNQPDFNATAARLLQNQQDIGSAIKPFYGNAAGDNLTQLLDTHILDAVAVMQAAKAGNSTALNSSLSSWYTNANSIADFVSGANPYISDSGMKAMMKEHLDLTLAEAADQLQGNYTGSVSEYDSVHAEILNMSDMLSAGIMRQFPQDFYNATLGTS